MAPPLQRAGESSSSGSGLQSSSRDVSAQISAENKRMMEKIAHNHWTAFRVFLDSGGSQNHPRQNKAREKLTRLSSVQFQELSTDVYDEVIRRTKPTSSGSSSLPANPRFHPKRNQAREKLASLQIMRFKDLASDVFFEIERRFPSVMRPSGSQRSNASTDRASSDVGTMKSDRGQHGNTSNQTRQPNVFRQTAVIPTKSTMIEEDGDSDVETDSRSAGRSSHNSSGYGGLGAQSTSDVNRSPRTSKLSNTATSPSKVNELLTKIQRLEAELKKQTEASMDALQLRRDMEEVLTRNDKLEDQLAALKANANDRMVAATGNNELARENEQLRKELAEQRDVSEEVRREAGGFLQEMRELSERENAFYGQSETLQARVSALEGEVENWKENYFKIKTQLRQFRATSQFFSPMADLKAPGASAFVDASGLIKDVSVTKFQTSIDTLLRIARTDVPAMPECMKEIILIIRSIQKDLDISTSSTAKDPRVLKLKQRMSSTANNLMTACKNHANGGPLSPVSLVDAAASHLSSTVIEIVKICKLYSTPDDVEVHARPVQNLSRANTNDSVARRPQALQHTNSSPAYDIDRDMSPSPKSPARRAFPENASDDRVDGPPRQSNGTAKAASSSEIADKLRLFLENQTEEIVSAIQRLLSAVRSDAKTPVLQTYMGEIVTIVNGVTTSMREAFESSQPLQQSAGAIVEALESCIMRIREMENSASRSSESQASKEFKQRLAGIAFDTAKQTKELSIILQAAQEDEVDLT